MSESKAYGWARIGIGAAFLAAFLALMIFLSIKPKALTVAVAPAAENYREMCAGALVKARHLSARLRLAELDATDPAIVLEGPPVRIQCAIDGGSGAVTADVICRNALEPDCVRPVSAVLGGNILFAPE